MVIFTFKFYIVLAFLQKPRWSQRNTLTPLTLEIYVARTDRAELDVRKAQIKGLIT